VGSRPLDHQISALAISATALLAATWVQPVLHVLAPVAALPARTTLPLGSFQARSLMLVPAVDAKSEGYVVAGLADGSVVSARLTSAGALVDVASVAVGEDAVELRLIQDRQGHCMLFRWSC
jgi:hypothetical protein